MTKTVLIALTIVIFILAMKRLLIFLLCSEQKGAKQENDEHAPTNTQMCEQCSVGKESYEIDEHSEVCPYFEGRDGKVCNFFKPLAEKEGK